MIDLKIGTMILGALGEVFTLTEDSDDTLTFTLFQGPVGIQGPKNMPINS